LLFKYKNKNINIVQIIISVISLFILITPFFLPVISLQYPIERLYQTLMIVLSLNAIYGMSILTDKFSKFGILINCLFLLVYFLFSAGVIQQAIGYSDPPLQFNNFGSTYDALYTNMAEVSSIKWFAENHPPRDYTLFSDKPSFRKIMAFGLIYNQVSMDFMPSTFRKNSYVYSSALNQKKGRAIILFNGRYIGYNYPMQFLQDNKNRIFNNGGSSIFR
jgi:uncharacterized membrane protein